VHVKDWHTLDILLAEISTICYWFNPGVWLMKKAVKENIEFITDRKILQGGIDSKAYQYSLLNVSIAETSSAGIANHFNFSTLKKRIKMMNAKKSSNLNLTRYAVLVPVVTVLLLVFSFSKAELIKRNRDRLTHTLNATIDGRLDRSLKSQPAKSISKPNKTTSTNIQKAVGSKVDYVTINGIKLPIGVPAESFLKDIDNADTIKKNGNINLNKSGKIDSVTYIINGVKATKADYANLMSEGKPLTNTIKAVNVNGNNAYVSKVQTTYSVKIKDDTSKTLNGENHITFTPDANMVKITGNDGVAITTSKSEFSTSPSKQPYRAVIMNPQPQITDFSDKAISIDNKPADEKAMNKLKASEIQIITTIEPKSYTGPVSEMVAKYGEKAKNGVILIFTKKSK
jgi:bla regulator protein BlaR1